MLCELDEEEEMREAFLVGSLQPGVRAVIGPQAARTIEDVWPGLGPAQGQCRVAATLLHISDFSSRRIPSRCVCSADLLRRVLGLRRSFAAQRRKFIVVRVRALSSWAPAAADSTICILIIHFARKPVRNHNFIKLAL